MSEIVFKNAHGKILGKIDEYTTTIYEEWQRAKLIEQCPDCKAKGSKAKCSKCTYEETDEKQQE